MGGGGRKRWWIAGMAALLVGILFLHGWRARDTPSEDVYIGKPLYSADGKYMAILFSDSGGGGISPYCIDEVSVAPASMTAKEAYATRFRVYEGGCHSLGFVERPNKNPILENAPKLRWSSPRELEITIDPKQAAFDVRKVLFASQNEDGHVRITQNPFHH